MNYPLIAQYYKVVEHILAVVALCSVRITAILGIVPFFGDRYISGFTRTGVMLVLSFVLIPMTLPTVPMDSLSVYTMVGISIKEVFLGLVMGVICGIPFWALEGVGGLVDAQAGATMGSVFNPMTGDNTGPMSLLLLNTMTVVFFTTGGFLAFLGSLFESYKMFPIMTFFPHYTTEFPWVCLRFLDKIMMLAVFCASPISIVLFLSEFGLGMMNRFAPSLNVFSISMGVKAGMATFMMVIYIRVLISYFNAQLVGLDQLVNFMRALFLPPA